MRMKSVVFICLVAASTFLTAGFALGGPGCGGHGRHLPETAVLTPSLTEIGVQVAVTSENPEDVEAIQAHFAKIADRWALGQGCREGHGCEAKVGACDGAKGGECKCGGDCKCGQGGGCDCAKGGECKCRHAMGKRHLFSQCDLPDATLTVVNTQNGVMVEIVAVSVESVDILHDRFSDVQPPMDAEGCGCRKVTVPFDACVFT